MAPSNRNDSVIRKVPALSLEAEEQLLALHPPAVPSLSLRTSILGDAERDFGSQAQAPQFLLHGTGRISSVPRG